jgi:hypothetical protein
MLNLLFRTGFVLLLVLILFQIHSVRSDAYNGFDLSQSMVPLNEIYHGGPSRDDIPALIDPEFVPAKEAVWLNDNDRILGIEIHGDSKAYPLNIMNWHEIVNDRIRKKPVLITYCPLCYSGMAFDAMITGERHLFGVSGLLYNNDVLLYDYKTESLWSQIKSSAISGKFAGRSLQAIPLINTTWKNWREKYPDSQVLSKDTGYSRNYTIDPYADYKLSTDTYFPVTFRSKGYHPKEPVIGITLNNIAKAYPVSELSLSPGFFVDTIAGKQVFVQYNHNDKSGMLKDEYCRPMPAIMLYWFAWYAFHPETHIYKNDRTKKNVEHNLCLN